MNLEDAADRDQALTVPCTWCNAQPGEVCVRRGTDDPLLNIAAHLSRMHAAGVMHAPLDSRELRATHERTPR